VLGYVTLFRHVHQSAYFKLILGTSKRISRQNPNWPRTKNSLNLTETGWLNKIRPLSFTAHIFKISNWYLRFTELDEKKLVLTSWAHFFSWKTNNNFNHIYVKSYLMTHNTISKLFVSTFLTERYYIMFGYCHRNSVRRLSVCLSVTLMSLTHTVELFRIMFAPYCWLAMLTQLWRKQHEDIRKPEGVVMYKGQGVWKSRFSTNILLYLDQSLYIGNDTRYGHSYSGRRIQTRMRSIEWCHFQWAWVTPNLNFNVTIFFNVK